MWLRITTEVRTESSVSEPTAKNLQGMRGINPEIKMTKTRRQKENESIRRGLQGVKVTSQRWDCFLPECFLHLGVRVSESTQGSSLNPALVGA